MTTSRGQRRFRLFLAARHVLLRAPGVAGLWVATVALFYLTYLAAWNATRPVAQPLVHTQAFRTSVQMATAFEVLGLAVLIGASLADRVALSGHPNRRRLGGQVQRRRLMPLAAAALLHLGAAALLLGLALARARGDTADTIALVVNVAALLALAASAGWGWLSLAHRIHDPHRQALHTLGNGLTTLLAGGLGWLAYKLYVWLGWGG